MPKTCAASRGASSFCTVRLLRIRRIQHCEPYDQYVSIRMRRRPVWVSARGALLAAWVTFQSHSRANVRGKPYNTVENADGSHIHAVHEELFWKSWQTKTYAKRLSSSGQR